MTIQCQLKDQKYRSSSLASPEEEESDTARTSRAISYLRLLFESGTVRVHLFTIPPDANFGYHYKDSAQFFRREDGLPGRYFYFNQSCQSSTRGWEV